MATCHHKTESVGTAIPSGAVATHVTSLVLIQTCNGCLITRSVLYRAHIQGHVLTGFQRAPRAYMPSSTVQTF